MNDLLLTCSLVAFGGFFTAFVLITAFVLRPSKKEELESHALIPLKEGSEP